MPARKRTPTVTGVVAVLFVLAVAALTQLYTRARAAPVTEDGGTVCFSPKGGCTELIVGHLAAAQSSVRVQAYSFTSAPIAQALVDAHQRGVKVTVILDRDQRTDQYSSATFLHNHDIPVRIDAKHAIAHNKIMIIDGKTVITGSFNFTKQAEQGNAENLVILEGKARIVQAYQENFEQHLGHSERYTGP
jgi:phosphatidylserine/phosphatidylglycerophosphate/cardiolipin synthase-like enzyme